MKKQFYSCLLFLFAVCIFFLPGCGSSKENASSASTEPPVYSPLQVLVPKAPGTDTLGSDPFVLDISNIAQGYLTAASSSTDSRMNLQLVAPDGTNYSYFIEAGESAVIPFSSGSGNYLITCYQQVGGTQYAALYSESIDVTLENEFLPYIYPNQYVNFSPDSKASKLALSMLDEDATDVDALKAIYNYVTENLTYDTELAQTVDSGYLPDVDSTLESGKGICFDYAALATAMLRSRDIPCKLQIGYAGDIKHAWIDVYIKSKGWVNNAIEFNGESWSRMDPTFDSNSEDEELIQNYIGDDTNYTLQFSR